MNSAHPEQQRRAICVIARGFTVIEVLVSVAVIGVLVAIMLPTIALVQESARKVVCASNTRQIGIGLNLFAQDRDDTLPPSTFQPTTSLANGRAIQQSRPDLMDTVRIGAESGHAPGEWGRWDGIGLLYSLEYLNAPDIYYCPSHMGNHSAERYEQQWDVDATSEIIANYQFRGVGPDGQTKMYNIPARSAIVTDTLRSYEDLNHETGFNVLHAGLSVSWADGDGSQQIMDLLFRGSSDDDSGPIIVQQAWTHLDGGGTSRPTD
jgi:prepilin-type N-terminal cleavage/methylation domain-containing protein